MKEKNNIEQVIQTVYKSSNDLEIEGKKRLDAHIAQKIAHGKQRQNNPSFIDKVQLLLKNRKFLTIGGVTIGVILLLTVLFITLPINLQFPFIKTRERVFASEFDIQPESLSENGVSVNSSFAINTELNLSEDFYRQHLQITPAIEYDIERTGDGVTINPSQSLDKGVTYTFTLPKGTSIDGVSLSEDLSWSYRTEPDFAIIDSTPRLGSDEVPVNSPIEIEFNYDDVDVNSILPNFYSYPEITFDRVEQHGKNFVLIPKENLIEDQSYIFTLDISITRLTGEHLKTRYSGSFRTQDNSSSVKNTRPSIFLTSRSDTPEILNNNNEFEVSINDNDGNHSQALVTIHKVKHELIPDASTEIARQYDVLSGYVNKIPDKYLVETEREFYDPFEIQTLQILDVAVGDIFYVEIEYEHTKAGAYFIKTEMSSHALITNDSVVLSLYGKSGNLINGNAHILYIDRENNYRVKKVSLDGSTQTDKSREDTVVGVLFEYNDTYLLNLSDNRPFDFSIYGSGLITGNSNINSDNYVVHTTFDKPIYTNEDEVRFKTTIRTSQDFVNFNSIDPAKFTYNAVIGDTIIHTGKPSEINTDFSYFVDEFSIPSQITNQINTFGRIEVLYGDAVVGTSYFSFANYSKPKYTISIEIDEPRIVRVGDTVTGKIRATDIAGNPLSGESIEFETTARQVDRIWSADDSMNLYSYTVIEVLSQDNVILNPDGTSTFSFIVPDVPTESVDMFAISIKASLNKEYGDEKTVFASKGKETFLAQTEGKTLYYSIGTTAKINIQSVDPNTLEGRKIENPTVELRRKWSEQVESGTFYNPETKLIEPTYNTIEHNDIVLTNQVSLDDLGNGSFNHKITDDGQYILTITWKDSAGRTVRNSDHLFTVIRELGQITGNSPSLTFNKSSYAVGDTMIVSIKFPQGELPGKDVTLLIYKNSILQKETFKFNGETIEKHYTVTEDFSPKVTVGVIYASTSDIVYVDRGFDPKAFTNMSFSVLTKNSFNVTNPQDQLNVSVKTDKETYAPGEEVRTTISVTDQEGNTVPEANITLKAFDRALLFVLNRDGIYSHNLYDETYQTYQYKDQNFLFPFSDTGGGFGGTAGPTNVRKNFSDVAIFNTNAVTNDSGQVVLTFTAPDSITSWILDAEAITKDFSVGNNDSLFIVNKDIIVDVQLPKQMHQMDTIVLPVGVTNYTNNEIVGKLKFEGDANVTIEEFNDNLSIPAHSSEKRDITVSVKAEAIGSTKFTVTMSTDNILLDGIEKIVPVFPIATPSAIFERGEIHSGASEISIDLPEDASEQIGILSLSNNLFELESRPQDYSVSSLREIEASIIHNISLYKHYGELENPHFDKDTLKDSIELSLQALADRQDDVTGGFSWFGYDAIDPEASALVAYIWGEADRNNLSSDYSGKSKLADYLANQVFTSDGENTQTSIEDKILAIWGLSYLQDERGKIYAQVFKNDLSKIDSSFGLALLAQSFTVFGDEGSARTISLLLGEKAIIDRDFAYFDPLDKPYTFAADKVFVTSIAMNVIHLANANPELDQKIRTWVIREWDSTSDSLHRSIIYSQLSDLKTEFSSSTRQNISVYINGENAYSNVHVNDGLTTSLLLSNLNPGTNTIRIDGLSDSLFFNVQTKYLSSDTLSENKFNVSTQFINLSDGNTETLPYGGYVRMRVEVVPKQDIKDVSVQAYIPTGLRPLTAYQDFVFTQALVQWTLSVENENVNRYGTYSSDYVVFNEQFSPNDKHNRGKAGVPLYYEVLLVSDKMGTFTTSGTFVLQSGSSIAQGYDPKKTIVIK